MGNQIHPTSTIGPSHSHSGLIGHGGSDHFFGLSEPLWKFLDFIAMHRSPLYTLLLPFIHTRARIPADNDQELTFQLCAKVIFSSFYRIHKQVSTQHSVCELNAFRV